MVCTESSWEYLSKYRSSIPLDQRNDETLENLTITYFKKDVEPLSRFSSMDKRANSKTEFTEIQLHQIKTGIGLIEELWQDFSMGANQITYSQLLSGHKYMKEIGNELFSTIFLEQKLPTQVEAAFSLESTF